MKGFNGKMETVGVKLGKEIRKIRNSLGMSQEELAFKAGISAAHLGQIERAAKNPTVDTVAGIADALGVSLSELFSFNFDPDKQENPTLLSRIMNNAASMSEENQKELLRMMRIFRRVSRGASI
ncbi:MAG: helix-turn-helix domain-containing protein [Candidatus Ornithomonoglobus sp.]